MSPGPLGDLSSGEQTELLSPAWFAVQLKAQENTARATMAKHGVPVIAMPSGTRRTEENRKRAEYLRDKLLKERSTDKRIKWLRAAAWWKDVVRAANRQELDGFE